jgi:hypothetical protein
MCSDEVQRNRRQSVLSLSLLQSPQQPLELLHRTAYHFVKLVHIIAANETVSSPDRTLLQVSECACRSLVCSRAAICPLGKEQCPPGRAKGTCSCQEYCP